MPWRREVQEISPSQGEILQCSHVTSASAVAEQLFSPTERFCELQNETDCLMGMSKWGCLSALPGEQDSGLTSQHCDEIGHLSDLTHGILHVIKPNKNKHPF